MTQVHPDRPPAANEPWPAVYLRALPRITLWSLVAGLLSLGIALALPSRYTANISFVAAENPSDNNLTTGGIAALASRIGIGGLANSESPEFYATLLDDRSILDPVIQDTFQTSRGQTETLLTLLDAGGNTPARRLELAALKLGKRTSTLVDDQTNIVTLTVELPDPIVVADVANLLVARLDTFNQTTRKSEAHDRRRFVETRLAAARRELAEDEDSLRTFYVRNRRISDSPVLLFEETRLKRNVDLQENLFESLSQEYEQARIDEVRDTPVLTVLQPAIVPTKRSWPKRAVSAAFGFVAIVILGLAWTTWKELARRTELAAATNAALAAAFNDVLSWRHRRSATGRQTG